MRLRFAPAFDVGTPLVFDLGVYLVVMGVTLTIILSLAEEPGDRPRDSAS